MEIPSSKPSPSRPAPRSAFFALAAQASRAFAAMAARLAPSLFAFAAFAALATLAPALALAQGAALEPVVVTESRRPESLEELTRSVDVISGDDIRSSAASSLADYLGRLGFQVRAARGANYGEETITMRGLATSVFGTDINTDILVLVDGRRTGSDSLSLVDPNMIERVEVIRGPGAVQYGSAAMGGVVNVITQRGGELARLRLEAGAGSFQARKLAASASGRLGAFDLAAGLAYGQAGDYRDGRGRLWPHSSMGGRLTYLARAGWTFAPGHRIGVTVQGARLDELGGLVGASASSLRSYVQYQDKTMESLEVLYEGAEGGLGWQARWFGGETGYVLSRHPSLAGRAGPSYVGAETTNDFQGAQASLAWEGGALSLVAGADWLRYDFLQLQAGAAGAPETAGQSLYQNLGLYALAKLRLLEDGRLVLSAGLRRDHYQVRVENLKAAQGAAPAERSAADRSFDKLLPSVGLAFSPVPGLRLFSNYAIAYKVPTPRQLTGNYYMGSTLFLGDLSIRPETSRSLDFGAEARLGPLFAAASWFHTDYRDMISFQRISNAPPVSQHLNIDAAVIDGLELKLAFELAGPLGLDGRLQPYLNLTRLSRFHGRDGKKLPDVARDSLGLGVAFEHDPWGLALSLDGTYLGAIDVAGSLANQTPSGRTGGVTVWDLALTKSLWESGGGRLKVKASAKNLFGKFYDTSDGDVMPGASYHLALIWER
jgi:vitamin B12 transporter